MENPSLDDWELYNIWRADLFFRGLKHDYSYNYFLELCEKKKQSEIKGETKLNKLIA